MQYRKKPVVIEAIQFTRKNYMEIVEFTNGQAYGFYCEKKLGGKCFCTIPTLEGNHTAAENDYIIKGVDDEFYPCKPDIFEKTYEEAYGDETD